MHDDRYDYENKAPYKVTKMMGDLSSPRVIVGFPKR